MQHLLSTGASGGRSAAGRMMRPLDYLIEGIAPCPWGTLSASHGIHDLDTTHRRPLYTPAERARRDATAWTMVQGVLAPIQFLVFLVSAALVINFLVSGEGYAIATASIILKTVLLYAIMITGSIWEKEVFGKYLFAPAFYWEDMVSMLVLVLHTTYLAMLAFGWGTAEDMMLVALAAYATYAINATQFILKLRAARLDAGSMRGIAA